MTISRRRFLGQSSLLAAATTLPACWANVEDLPENRALKLRYAVASDLHYRGNSEQKAQEMVAWINQEKRENGLDAFFINGDVTHDRADFLTTLRDRHLSQLDVPYYCSKGNHDYIDADPGSPTGSWEQVWGYPANHSFVLNDFAFVMADSSAPSDFRPWLAADPAWLAEQFEAYRDAPAVFVLIHIAQREEGVDGWPQYGVHASDQTARGEEVMRLIESTPNVKAIFHGHNHSEAGMWVSGEKRYFFTGHAGGWWGLAKGYRIVEIDDQHRMVTYQVDCEQGGVLNRNAFA